MVTILQFKERPSEVFDTGSYVVCRTSDGHLRLVDIRMFIVGCALLEMLYMRALEVVRTDRKAPAYVAITGGSTYGAYLSYEVVKKLFETWLDRLAIPFALVGLHFCRSGRLDFHVLAVNSRADGQVLARKLRFLRIMMRREMRKLVFGLNRQRLKDGLPSIGIITDSGRVHFMEVSDGPEPLMAPMETGPIVTAATNESLLLLAPPVSGSIDVSDASEKKVPEVPETSPPDEGEDKRVAPVQPANLTPSPSEREENDLAPAQAANLRQEPGHGGLEPGSGSTEKRTAAVARFPPRSCDVQLSFGLGMQAVEDSDAVKRAKKKKEEEEKLEALRRLLLARVDFHRPAPPGWDICLEPEEKLLPWEKRPSAHTILMRMIERAVDFDTHTETVAGFLAAARQTLIEHETDILPPKDTWSFTR